MSEGGDKVHDPTPKKIEDALAKGDTPASRELVLLGSLAGIAIAAAVKGNDAAATLGLALRAAWDQADAAVLEDADTALALLSGTASSAGGALGPFVAIVAAGGLAAALAQRPRVAAKRVKPDPSKLSPAKGFTRLFGPAGLFEFTKSVVKIGVVGAVLTWMLAPRMPRLAALIDADPLVMPAALAAELSRTALLVTLLIVPLAAADTLWSRHRWRHRLRMSHEELREEMKGSEGDPTVKGRRLSLRRARSRQSMVAAVDGASLVVANPTHYAVALRYERGRDAAPVVVAKGRDHIALRIRARAEEKGVPVFEVPPLARALHAGVALDRPIPEEFYELVADLVRQIYAA